MTGLYFRCLIRELTPISVGWFQYAFSADVICDCPYAYSAPFEQKFTGGLQPTETILRNFGTARENIRPTITIESEKLYHVYLTNDTTKQSLEFHFDTDIYDAKLIIDGQTGLVAATSGGGYFDAYPYFNFQFLEMASGDNDMLIWIPPGDGTVTFTGRYLHNVGA